MLATHLYVLFSSLTTLKTSVMHLVKGSDVSTTNYESTVMIYSTLLW